ncbi:MULTISPECIES: ExbD/TolR family protein [Dysgonomonas]|uniref:ExbD/TolR family protein n=1 Tax=Dysgonomonas TaxID=156973 RepID=UPI000926AF5B|nr:MULTISPECIES: biopolymer transporter ExbD [Dysgonomonas]MBN9301084.1 biopolymer transporter ExbD [Dysgonomonas mossii]OJX58217.1 MAG: biopolymer transporter ExbD [Dysgonomonas sp. 37-18]
MANIDTTGKSETKKGRPERKILRVDFTPMVDMNLLLITFFMFCTTLSIPQIMDVAMPTDKGEQAVPDSKSVTVILGENDKVYYYEGLANYENYTSLKETNTLGLRNMLLTRNNANMSKIKELRQKRYKKQITEKEFKEMSSNVKKSKDGLIVLIKPTEKSNYKNLVDALDEMQICGVGKYTIVDLEDGDKVLMENLKTKGKLTAMADRPE